MRFSSPRKMPRFVRSAFSTLAIVAVAAGAYASPFFVPVASANNGLTVSAVPNTGTLTPGQQLEIRVSDPSNTTDATSSSCTVNNVDVNSTFHNAGPGDYRYTYTVGAGDQSRTAGTVPINCTISQSVSVNVTAFDDNNTVAINTAPAAPLAFSTGAMPTSGTLTAAQQLEVYFRETNGNTNVGLDGACRVNDQDVSSTFQNLTDGLYRVIYIVGASDNDRAEGQIPVDCSLKDNTTGATAHVVSFNDSNTVAVHALGNDTGENGNGTSTATTTAPTITMASVSPNSGMLVAGNSLTVTFSEGHSMTDLTLTGACTVNSRDISGSWHSTGGGQYVATYTVQPGDAERSAGQIPVNCTMGNAGGNVTTNAWLDNNMVAIDSNGNGTIDSSTTSPNFTTSVNPSTGTLNAGDQATISFQNDSADGSIAVDFCRINDIDVAPSYHHVGNGLYQVTYTVQSDHATRAAGEIPVDCTMHNSAGSYHVAGFTTANTLAVDPTTSGNGGNNGGNNGGSASSTLNFTVGAIPTSGMIAEGQNLEVYFTEVNHDAQVGLNGACTVNNVDVSSTFQNLTDGLYRVIYNVGVSDTPRPSGTIPVSCSLKNNTSGATAQLNAFTDGNTVAISVNGTTGDTGTSTGGTIGGDVTGGSNGTTTNGYLHVDSIQQVRDTATAGAGYSQGWAWKFVLTVPSNETSLSLKFANWTHTNGSATIDAGNNMRIWSNQAATTTPTSITAAGTYSDAMTLTGDLDPNTAGRQVEVMVEMQVPSNSLNGSYTTDYGVRSN